LPALLGFRVLRDCSLSAWKRWRAGLTAKHMGARIFGAAFLRRSFEGHHVSGGAFFAFPLAISSYFGSMSVIYTIIDIQSLISAALILRHSFIIRCG
jgi:hypothetical protein